MSKPTACAKEIIEQINTLRLNPSQYASKIEESIKFFYCAALNWVEIVELATLKSIFI